MTSDGGDAAAILEQARGLSAALGARAAETESLRRLPDDTVADIQSAGLHRLGQPVRFGGAELGLDEIAEVITALANSCAATAWVCGVWIDHSILTGMFDPAAAGDVWGSNENAKISAGFLPSGTNERVEGGWRLFGSWGFASGCDHADWVLLGSVLADGDEPPTPHLCLVPRGDFTIDDNWHVMGLAGTGSKNIVVDGAFVPDYRTLPLPAAIGGWAARGRPDVAPLYRLPHISTIPFLFCANALGIAEAMLDDILSGMPDRKFSGTPVAEFQTMQLHIAEASAEIDCARLLIKRDTSEAMAAMRRGEDLPMAIRARNRRDQAYSSRLCRQAVDRLFGAAGSHGIFEDNAAQRRYRDVRAAANHIAVSWDLSGTTYGRVALGLDPATPLV